MSVTEIEPVTVVFFWGVEVVYKHVVSPNLLVREGWRAIRG